MMNGWPRQWVADKGESPCTLQEALTYSVDPANPCASSQRVMQDFVSCQVFPAWTQGGGQMLLGQLEQVLEPSTIISPHSQVMPNSCFVFKSSQCSA